MHRIHQVLAVQQEVIAGISKDNDDITHFMMIGVQNMCNGRIKKSCENEVLFVVVDSNHKS